MPNTPKTHSSPYTRDNVRKGVFHYLLGRGMSGVAGFASVILLARNMSIESYAGYTALTGLIMMMGIVSGLGMERAIARYVPEARMNQSLASLEKLIWFTSLTRFTMALILTILIAIFWQTITTIFNIKLIKDFPWSLGWFLIGTTLFQHFSSVMQSLVLQKTLTRILVIQWGGRLLFILTIILIHSQITLDQSLWIMALPEVSGVLIFLWVINRHLLGLRQQGQPNGDSVSNQPPRWGEISVMAMHNYGYSLLAAPPQGYFMRMLAAAFLPIQFVAAYGFFLSLVERVRQYLPLQLMHNLVEPILIASFVKDGDFGKLSQRVHLMYKANLILLAPAIGFFVAVAPDITGLLAGGKFTQYAWLFILLFIQVSIGSYALTSQLALNATGHSAILLKSGIFGLIFMLLSFGLVFFNKKWELIVFCPLIYAIINNISIIRLFRLRGFAYTAPWFDIAKVVAFSATASIIAYLAINVIEVRALRVTIAIITNLIVFGTLLYVFPIIRAEDKRLIGSLQKA